MATLETAFSWRREVAELTHRQAFPPGWIRAAKWIFATEVVVIVVCLITGPIFYNDIADMFGEKRIGTVACVATLIGSGIVCFKIRSRVRGTPIAAFWLAFGILMCLTGIDDMFRVHEKLDFGIHKLMGWDPKDKSTDKLDDVLVSLYVLPAAYLTWKYRKQLITARLTVQVLGLAFAVFALHLLFDVMHAHKAIEESTKLTAGCLILLAFLATLFDRDLLARWSNPNVDA